MQLPVRAGCSSCESIVFDNLKDCLLAVRGEDGIKSKLGSLIGILLLKMTKVFASNESFNLKVRAKICMMMRLLLVDSCRRLIDACSCCWSLG